MYRHQLYHEIIQKQKYALRGSTLECSYGTSYSLLDLVQDHGIYKWKLPVLTTIDSCKSNICDFGACLCPESNYAGRLPMTVGIGKNGKTVRKASYNNFAHICIPMVPEGSVWKQLDSTVLAKTCAKGYAPMLVDSAVLVCQYGGIIRIIEVPQTGTTQGSGQIITLAQMQQVERTDNNGIVDSWRNSNIRDVLTWSTITYIPTYTATRSINQNDIDAINACLNKYNIIGEQIPHFIAQCSHECSCGATGIEKYGGSDPITYFSDRDIWRENFDDIDLAATDHIWNNQKAIKQYALTNGLKVKYKGYGAKYRGAGALQMTHYCEYKGYSEYIGDATIIEKGAGRVAEAYFWDSAGWLWKEYYKMHEKFANGVVPAVKDITFKINGGYNGLNERDDFYQCCKTIF